MHFNFMKRWAARHRNLFLFVGVILAAGLSWLSDPDNGMSTKLGALSLVQAVVAIALAHWGRKALMDYIEADWQTLYALCKRGNVAAGLALIAGAIVFVGLLMVFAPRAHAADRPSGFATYGPVLKAEQRAYWPSHPAPYFLAGLVEQESCISLKSSKCWNPSAQLKNSREEGAGLGQITRAYRQNGAVRFDALVDMRDRYTTELGDWSWSNVYRRPDLQLRAIVLMSRDAAMAFRAAPDMLKFGDAAYNGGVGGVQKERRSCAMTAGCDPGKWFGNVELHCLKSRQPIYGARSACDINREHVHGVFLVRSQKYIGAMG